MTERDNATLVLLTSALQVSVPLYIARLQQEPWSYVLKRAHECAQVVAEKGDVILYRSKTPGTTAAAFNHLAEGIACISFAVGGVTIFGQHWEATHPSAPRDQGIYLDAEWFKNVYERMIFGG